MKAVVVTTDNEVSIQDFDEPLYRTVGDSVGGYIEIVHPALLPDPYVMVVNEEGLLEDLPLNSCGSTLYASFIHGSPIVGNIVIMKEGPTEDGEWDILGLADSEAEEMAESMQSILDNIFERSKNND